MLFAWRAAGLNRLASVTASRSCGYGEGGEERPREGLRHRRCRQDGPGRRCASSSTTTKSRRSSWPTSTHPWAAAARPGSAKGPGGPGRHRRRRPGHALDPCDVCLNGSLPYFNEGVMEACLAAGCHYTDMGGLFHWAKKQLAMHDRFEAAGLTAVCGSGSAPGSSTSWRGMRRCASTRSSGSGSATASSTSRPRARRSCRPYSLDTLLNEFLMSAWPFKDGDWREMTPFSGRRGDRLPGAGRHADLLLHDPLRAADDPRVVPRQGHPRGAASSSSLPKAFEEQAALRGELGAAGTEPLEVNGHPRRAARRPHEAGRALARSGRGRRRPPTTTRSCASTCAEPRTGRSRTGASRPSSTRTRSGT